jgi:hypothetical protein
MSKHVFSVILASFYSLMAISQSAFPVNGFCIAAPSEQRVDEFVNFIADELAPSGINTLVLRVDFNYAYESRPELQDKNPLSKESVKKIVAVCQKNKIEVIPQVNLLGHQSWANKLNKLLEVYPDFDETPHVKIPETYEWPNDDGLYCKSYCPLHPEVHQVVFDLMDEIMEVFEAKAFHAGLDEVFYIADAKCPRCKGLDPAVLFAGEVNVLNKHLEEKGARLWIWGDRLLDGSTTGMGMWEASMNNTAMAIDLISKSVVICDWHYEKAIPTPAYFAMKGFDVIACSWRKPEVAKAQVKMVNSFKINSTPEMQKKFLGVMHTSWSSTGNFMDNYYDPKTKAKDEGSERACFEAMIVAVKEIDTIKK